VQIRCLLEGVDPQDMLLTWHDMLPQYMEHWQLDRNEVRCGQVVGGRVGQVCRQPSRGDAWLGVASPHHLSPPTCQYALACKPDLLVQLLMPLL
jgi:hypothetical protein